jgi:Fur family ferric uptake transcriptional regulator
VKRNAIVKPDRRRDDATAPPAAALERLRQRIRAAGLRCTAARLTVLHHLVNATGPLTHAEVSDAVSHAGFDRATIYRNLTELTEAGLVARMELGDHVWRFELRRPPRDRKGPENHPHFLCTTCGEVSCLEDVHVSIAPRERSGIHSVREVLLKGTCGACG